jgi:hypothetical protein
MSGRAIANGTNESAALHARATSRALSLAGSTAPCDHKHPRFRMRPRGNPVIIDIPDAESASRLEATCAGLAIFVHEAEEEALRHKALRITLSRTEQNALMDRLPASTIDYSLEDDELPC